MIDPKFVGPNLLPVYAKSDANSNTLYSKRMCVCVCVCVCVCMGLEFVFLCQRRGIKFIVRTHKARGSEEKGGGEEEREGGTD